MKYVVDIKVTGFIQVTVEAETDYEACDKASEVFDADYMNQPIGDLRWKATEAEIVEIIHE